MRIIILNSCHLLYDGAVRFLPLVLQQDIAKVQQHDLHGAGIGKDADLFSNLPFSKKPVDFCLHLRVFPVR